MPSEDTSGMLFVLRMLLYAGFDFAKFCVFTDRGKLLHACCLLSKEYNLEVSLKYCLEHIIRNVVHRFRPNKENGEENLIRGSMAAMQNANTVERLLSACARILTSSMSQKQQLLVYLLGGIHPRHWCVFANNSNYLDSVWQPKYYEFLGSLLGMTIDGDDGWKVVMETEMKDPVPVGDKFPLFDFCRNNRAESAANWLRTEGIRSLTPPLAVETYLTSAMRANSKFVLELREMAELSHTTICMKLHDDATRVAERHEVVSHEFVGGSELHIVVSSGRVGQTAGVFITEHMARCTCYHFNMYRTLCGHVQCGLRWLANQDWTPLVTQLSQVEYTVQCLPFWGRRVEVYEFLTSLKMAQVVHWMDIPYVTEEDMIFPSPSYRKGTRAGGKRFRSKGETGPSILSAIGSPGVEQQSSSGGRARLTMASEPTSRVKLTRKDLEQLATLTQEGYFNIFRDPSGKTPEAEPFLHRVTFSGKSRKSQYKCAECGSIDHNLRCCPYFLKGGRLYQAPSTIEPGSFVVFSFPERPEGSIAARPNSEDRHLHEMEMPELVLGEEGSFTRMSWDSSDDTTTIRSSSARDESTQSWFQGETEEDGSVVVGLSSSLHPSQSEANRVATSTLSIQTGDIRSTVFNDTDRLMDSQQVAKYLGPRTDEVKDINFVLPTPDPSSDESEDDGIALNDDATSHTSAKQKKGDDGDPLRGQGGNDCREGAGKEVQHVDKVEYVDKALSISMSGGRSQGDIDFGISTDDQLRTELEGMEARVRWLSFMQAFYLCKEHEYYVSAAKQSQVDAKVVELSPDKASPEKKKPNKLDFSFIKELQESIGNSSANFQRLCDDYTQAVMRLPLQRRHNDVTIVGKNPKSPKHSLSYDMIEDVIMSRWLNNFTIDALCSYSGPRRCRHLSWICRIPVLACRGTT